MSKLDIVDLAASGLDERSNAIWVQCKGAPVSDEDAPDFGRAPFMQALGVASRPAPATSSGNAQGVMAVGVCGYDGVCIGAHDNRCSKVFGEIKPGETALHATGENFDARVLCKDQMVAIIVGDDMVFVVDRKKKQIVANVEGCVMQLGGGNGVMLLDETGACGLQAKGGVLNLMGSQVIIGGRNAVSAVAMVPVTIGLPATGPSVPVPAAPGVFIGA